MTFGTWYRIKCGTCLEVPIYSPLTCPVRKAKYEVVKVLKKMHIARPVTITSKLNVVIPPVMAVQDEEEYQEYLEIIKIVQEELRKLKGKIVIPEPIALRL